MQRFAEGMPFRHNRNNLTITGSSGLHACRRQLPTLWVIPKHVKARPAKSTFRMICQSRLIWCTLVISYFITGWWGPINGSQPTPVGLDAVLGSRRPAVKPPLSTKGQTTDGYVFAKNESFSLNMQNYDTICKHTLEHEIQSSTTKKKMV